MGQTLGHLRFLLFSFLPDQFFSQLPVTQADLTGRTCLVTGSNTGLGLATAIHLARLKPTRLILAVRDVKKGNAAKEEITTETGFTGLIEVWELDMADFSSVKRFADKANATLDRLDGALLNAGINVPSWEKTVDGWEKTFQVNMLATGLLAILLLPLLHATSKLPSFIKRDRYPTSKLLIILFARAMAELPAAEGVVVNVGDPGLCISSIGSEYNLGAFAMSGSSDCFPTPSGAYISSCEIRPRSEDGLRVQKQVWNEMVEVWRGVAPEVDDIVKA
ncbi:hypothetical protein DFH09DRAFT_1249973 [Mycena vulgaris]|nr:hypothetical protein DFH09DRAFT_1249973 [Mycena vulgaris]